MMERSSASSVDEDEVVKMVRSCLLSVKGQISVIDLNKDYEALVGEKIPYRILGYNSLEQFLESLPGMEVGRAANGSVLVTASASTSTQHLADMVSKQKTTKKNFLKGITKKMSYPQSAAQQNGPQANGASTSTHNAGYGGAVKPPHSNYLGKNFIPNFRYRPQGAATVSVPTTHRPITYNKYDKGNAATAKGYTQPPRFQRKPRTPSPTPSPTSEDLWDDVTTSRSPEPQAPAEQAEPEPLPQVLEAESSELAVVEPRAEVNGTGARRRPLRSQTSSEGPSKNRGAQLRTMLHDHDLSVDESSSTRQKSVSTTTTSQQHRLMMGLEKAADSGSVVQSSLFPTLDDMCASTNEYQDCAHYRLMTLFAASNGYPKIELTNNVVHRVTIYILKVGYFVFERCLDPGLTPAATVDAICYEAHGTLTTLKLPIEQDFYAPVHMINRLLKIVYTMEVGIIFTQMAHAFKLIFDAELPPTWLKALVDANADNVVDVVMCAEDYNQSMLRPRLISRLEKAFHSELSSAAALPTYAASASALPMYAASALYPGSASALPAYHLPSASYPDSVLPSFHAGPIFASSAAGAPSFPAHDIAAYETSAQGKRSSFPAHDVAAYESSVQGKRPMERLSPLNLLASVLSAPASPKAMGAYEERGAMGAAESAPAYRAAETAPAYRAAETAPAYRAAETAPAYRAPGPARNMSFDEDLTGLTPFELECHHMSLAGAKAVLTKTVYEAEPAAVEQAASRVLAYEPEPIVNRIAPVESAPAKVEPTVLRPAATSHLKRPSPPVAVHVDMQPDVPRGLLWQITVLSCLAADNINVRIMGPPYEESYDQLRRDITRHYSQDMGVRATVSTLIVGSCYVAHYDNPVGWQRVQLLSVNPPLKMDQHRCDVLLIDTGDRRSMRIRDLYYLVPSLAEMPTQVVRCAMFGMDSFAGLMKYRLLMEDKLHMRTLIACVLGPETKVPVLTLHRERGPGNNELNGLSINFEVVESMCIGLQLPKALKEGESRGFKMVSLDEDGTLIVRAESDTHQFVTSMMEILQQCASIRKRFHKLSELGRPNSIYLVHHEATNKYMRAVTLPKPAPVLSPEGPEFTRVTVRLIDTGKVGTVHVGKLMLLSEVSEVLAVLPPKVVTMELFTPGQYAHLGGAMAKKLANTVNADTEVIAKVMAMGLHGPQVELSMVQAGNCYVALNDNFAFARLQKQQPLAQRPPDPEPPLEIEEEIVKATSAFAPVQPRQASNEVDICQLLARLSPLLVQTPDAQAVAPTLKQVSASSASPGPMYPTPSLSVGVTPAMPTPMMPQPPVPRPIMPVSWLPVPNVPSVGNHFDVHVPLASNPNNFFVQPWGERGLLEKLMMAMQAFYASQEAHEPVSMAEATVGRTMAAQHTDSHFYRVTVIGPGTEGNTAMVQFCDFGEITSVAPESLRILEPAFMMLPAQAIRSQLYGIKPRHQDWSMIDCILFQELVSEREFVSIIMEKFSTPENPNELKIGLLLIDTSGESDVRIDELLVDEQKAVYCTERQ